MKKERFFFFSGEEGLALLTVLLFLVLMSLSAFSLLSFAGTEVLISTNDKLSRVLLGRAEALNLYALQSLFKTDKDSLLRDSPLRPDWIHSERDAASFFSEALYEDILMGRSFSTLSYKELLSFVKSWPESGLQGVWSFDDNISYPFLNSGSGRVFVVDCGVSSSGSQDISGHIINSYIVFSEYKDDKGNSRLLEAGIKLKQKF